VLLVRVRAGTLEPEISKGLRFGKVKVKVKLSLCLIS
jgi:hypothetical protein